MKDDLEVRITLRLSASLRDRLNERAEANERSMNGEIVSRLEESLRSPYPELSGYGFEALVGNLAATVSALQDLFFAQRDKLTADDLQALRDTLENLGVERVKKPTRAKGS